MPRKPSTGPHSPRPETMYDARNQPTHQSLYLSILKLFAESFSYGAIGRIESNTGFELQTVNDVDDDSSI